MSPLLRVKDALRGDDPRQMIEAGIEITQNIE